MEEGQGDREVWPGAVSGKQGSPIEGWGQAVFRYQFIVIEG
jgi:hypothetical protein